MGLPEDPVERAWTVARFMQANDQVARAYGMEVEEARPGYARVAMEVRSGMLNAVGLIQGGATFSLADFAFAVASNSHGQVAVALSASISYPAPAREGDRLVAEAREVARSRRTGLYQVEVRRGDGVLTALFTGQVFFREDTVDAWLR